MHALGLTKQIGMAANVSLIYNKYTEWKWARYSKTADKIEMVLDWSEILRVFYVSSSLKNNWSLIALCLTLSLESAPFVSL